jgi:hypothetical protein
MREIISEKELQKKERRQVIDLAAFILVAGTRNQLKLLFEAAA